MLWSQELLYPRVFLAFHAQFENNSKICRLGGVVTIKEGCTLIETHSNFKLTNGGVVMNDGSRNNERRDSSASAASMAPFLRRASQDIKEVFTNSNSKSREKRLLDAAVSKFNIKPASGIDYLVANGMIKKTPEDIVQVYIHIQIFSFDFQN